MTYLSYQLNAKCVMFFGVLVTSNIAPIWLMEDPEGEPCILCQNRIVYPQYYNKLWANHTMSISKLIALGFSKPVIDDKHLICVSEHNICEEEFDLVINGQS